MISILFLLLLPTSVLGQFASPFNPTCIFSRTDIVQCNLCGDPTISDNGCRGYNASFESSGISDGQPLPVYNNTAWPGFVRLVQKKQGSLNPVSGSHYLALPPLSQGSMQFGFDGGVDGARYGKGSNSRGSLRYFSYACAAFDPVDPPIPIACDITISGYCHAINDGLAPRLRKYVITYQPALTITPSGMAYQALDFSAYIGITGIVCSNYTFSANYSALDFVTSQPYKDAHLGPILLMDNVYFSTWPAGT